MIKLKIKGRVQKRDFIMLWISLFALVLADGIVTEYLIAHGLASEGNQILAPLVGTSMFLPLKAAGAALAIFILWDISKFHSRIALVASCCFVAVYSAIVFWNVSLCFPDLIG